MLFRVAFLMSSPEPARILCGLFNSIKSKTRLILDDKEYTAENAWEKLAEYFNDKDWDGPFPCQFDVPEVKRLDPKKPPAQPWSSVDLRNKFNYLRSELTKVCRG